MKSFDSGSGTGAMALILIVDDDQYVRASLENLLESVGYSTQSAPSAEAFLASYQVDRGDCLILDVRMKMMTGLELQRKLNAMGRRTPIIFLTAHCDDDTRERALRGGASAFLCKPFKEDELLAAIDRAVSGNLPPPE
ncbi:response regulator transcription factor [Paraburkholderia sediminicola]|uniref:response regulator transcription factor n=1 Tax=Paraburkholderia sediminicola TaxID=458836 RepID=UPI0038B98507